MSAVAIDPIAILEAAGEGRFEFAGSSLIEMAPASHDHIDKSWFLTTLLKTFVQARGGGLSVGDGFVQRLDKITARVPDVAYFRPESLPRVRPTFSEGGADLVVEIVSTDSQARDRGEKFVEYERAGVEEYWIVDPIRRNADFYRLDQGVYHPVLPDADGRIHSSVLPDFWIRVDWLWNAPDLVDALRELGLI